MGKAKLRGSFQQRLLSTYNKKVNSIGLQAKTLEDIANVSEQLIFILKNYDFDN